MPLAYNPIPYDQYGKQYAPQTTTTGTWPTLGTYWTDPATTPAEPPVDDDLFSAIRTVLEDIAGSTACSADTMIHLDGLCQKLKCLQEDLELGKIRLELARSIAVDKLTK